jgi:two-component system chemotaxis sensor kinase CheA
LLELVRLEGEQAQRGIELIHGAPVYRLRGNLLPLVYLNRELQVSPGGVRSQGLGVRGQDQGSSALSPDSRLLTPEQEINIVVLQADERQFGLIVDAIHDTEEIVVKPLQKQIKGISAFAGATIMGDGKVALILDVLGLAQRANVISGARERALTEKSTAAPDQAEERQTVLLCADRNGGRLAIPLTQVDRLEEFPRSAIERVGSHEVVQYRDEILPLIHVSRVLRQRKHSSNGRARAHHPEASRERKKEKASERQQEGDTIQVVVYASKGRRVGLVVGRILDIVEGTLASRSRANRPGVLFTAVIQERVTELLDIEGIIHSADPDFFAPHSPSATSPVLAEA